MMWRARRVTAVGCGVGTWRGALIWRVGPAGRSRAEELVETGGARLEQSACQQPNRQGKQRNASGEVGSSVVGLAARHQSRWFCYGLFYFFVTYRLFQGRQDSFITFSVIRDETVYGCSVV